MTAQEQQARWEACYAQTSATEAPPLPLLAAQAALLPLSGDALDLACGRGGNALFLARCGLQTQAWDYAASAVAALQLQAGELPLRAECRDVVAQPPLPNTFDVIVVAHFLHRPLFPFLVAALRPGGLLFYETWAGPYTGRGPRNPAYRLISGELEQAFSGLLPLFFHQDEDRITGVWKSAASGAALA
ncbi:MAG: class I SAM-dependent methyltransferase [Acidithiobacillus sp.]